MELYTDFSAILFFATAICALIWLIDVLVLRKKRQATGGNEPKMVEYARSFFPILLAVFVLRTFIVEPFRIPSGSMKPTLLEGDFILVNKYTYGLRLPLVATKVWDNKVPKRGDVLVFRYPKDPSVDFIKRVIGVAGDKIRYEDKKLYINGEQMNQDFVGSVFDNLLTGQSLAVKHYKEALPEVTHSIFLNERFAKDMNEVTVPEGMFFVMGDNRDSSEDSREWGFVPDKLILGRAFYIWFSWDPLKKDVRWKRIGKEIV